MVVKNGIYEAEIVRSGMDGEGIAEIEGMIVFVPHLLVGERAQIRVLSVKKRYAYGRVEKILSASKNRVLPSCPVYERCGGCSLMHASYEEELRVKREKIVASLRSVDGVDENGVEVVGSQCELGYRNKVSLPVREVGDRLCVGFFSERSHRFVPHANCVLHSAELEAVVEKVLLLLNERRLSAYDDVTGKGYVRHIAVRELSDSFSVTVVVNSDDIAPIESLRGRISSKDGRPVTLYANVNKKNTNVIFGDKFVKIEGDVPKGKMCGVEFELHPASFLQVNTSLAERIYGDVKNLLGNTDYLVDCYSGIGITSNVFAPAVKKVFAVEIVPEAVENAVALARSNGNGDKIENVCGDCATVVPEIVERVKGKGRVAVFLDPPRKGCDEGVLRSIASVEPERIVYLSCNPASLARDLKVLLAYGYKVELVRGYDLFPRTKHVETVVCLEQMT